MQRYMRSEMPFHGVASPGVSAICKRLFDQLEFSTSTRWKRTTLYLWRQAKFREERYASILLSDVRTASAFQNLSALPMYEEMIVTGAWWDYVDTLAANRLGPILRRSPEPMGQIMRRWSRSDDLWKRRSSIICQLRFGNSTDRALLFDCIEPSLESREFFLRKAIGWALRQYARVQPTEVSVYVRKNETRLSPLSRREALRHISPHP
ncbi:MAG: DNA alkylation repair protein [Thermoplasmata archaeon]|nr:DNA alkylation repair protein [Thermoplasmata archaeon]